MTSDSERAPSLDAFEPRTIVGDDGREWIVYEAAPGCYDRRASSSLVFWTGNEVMRRVRHFPKNWRDLPDSALYALTLQTRRHALNETSGDEGED